jgi:GNAT superfamily N-acetyltransferase
LDEFFAVDSIVGGRELVAVTYALLDADGEVAAFFSVSNDSIKAEQVPRTAWKRVQKFVEREKRYSSMPATKIGRLGVRQHGQKHGVGSDILAYLKVWFTHENKTGCRFLTVDAYNTPRVVSFYQKNGFNFHTDADKNAVTRIMYFDLKTFVPDDADAAPAASAEPAPAEPVS